MIGYVTVGADDLAKAKLYYSAFLPELGYELDEGPEGLSYTLTVEKGTRPSRPDFYVKPTFNGEPASVGKGAMVAFDARSQNKYLDSSLQAWPLVVLMKDSRDFVTSIMRISL